MMKNLWPWKWGVDLYTRSTYTQVNTVSYKIWSINGVDNGNYVPYLLVYKSTPHFHGQKSDFSSFMVKEVKFRPIEISFSPMNVLKTRWIKKSRAKCNRVVWSSKFIKGVVCHHVLSTHKHFDFLEKYFTIFASKSHCI